MKVLTRKLKDALGKKSQGFDRVQIFSESNLSSSPLSLEYVILPKGDESVPHIHVDTHTVVFTIQGGVKIYYGERLENQVIVEKDESVYIPPDLIHHVVNENEEDMIAVVARTKPNRGVVEFPELLKLITNH